MGCEQGDWYIWMRVWGQQDTRQGNWGHQLWDAGTIVGQGLGMSNIGTLMIIAKVRGKCDITRLQELTEGDAICREMKNEN